MKSGTLVKNIRANAPDVSSHLSIVINDKTDTNAAIEAAIKLTVYPNENPRIVDPTSNAVATISAIR